jgi:hypothetical protein
VVTTVHCSPDPKSQTGSTTGKRHRSGQKTPYPLGVHPEKALSKMMVQAISTIAER